MKKICVSIILALVSLNIFSQTLSVELGSIPETAVSQCTGKAWVQVTGGTAPYTFQWNTGDTSTYLENLCLGTYSVTVTDATTATAIDTVVFNTSNQIIIPLLGNDGTYKSKYGFCDGVIYFNSYNGISPYNYKLFYANSGKMLFNSTTDYATNLCAGNYYSVITDANGGTKFQPVTVLNEFLIIDPQIQNPNGPNPSMPINIHIYGEVPININIILQSDTIMHYTIYHSDTTILYMPYNDGQYQVSLIDNSGNIDNDNFCHENNWGAPNVNFQDATNGCNGSIYPNQGAYYFYLNYQLPGTNTYVNIDNYGNYNLCPGTYQYSYSTSTCGFYKNGSITIGGPQPNYPQLDITTLNTTTNICIGEAWVDVTGGTPPYTYQWQGASNASSTTDYEDILCAGNVIVKVTDSNNVWVYGVANIGSTMPTTVPGDTIWASADSCISNIDEAYIYAYTINNYTVDITWAIVQNGVLSYLDVSYNYTITLPGTYNVGLLFTCKNSTKFFSSFRLIITDIEGEDANKINIYPNPATDYLNLSLNSNIVAFDVMTISGQKINSYEAKGNQMTINVSNLAEGVYFIRFVNSDGSFIVKKFVR